MMPRCQALIRTGCTSLRKERELNVRLQEVVDAAARRAGSGTSTGGSTALGGRSTGARSVRGRVCTGRRGRRRRRRAAGGRRLVLRGRRRAARRGLGLGSRSRCGRRRGGRSRSRGRSGSLLVGGRLGCGRGAGLGGFLSGDFPGASPEVAQVEGSTGERLENGRGQVKSTVGAFLALGIINK